MNTKDQVVKNREVGLKKLYILSKVSARKEVARDRLEKMAIIIPYMIYKYMDRYSDDNFISKDTFETMGGDEDIYKIFKEVMGLPLGDWIKKNDTAQNQGLFMTGRNYNYKLAVNALYNALEKQSYKKNNVAENNNLNLGAEQALAREPEGVKRTTSQKPNLENLRRLLNKAGFDPGNGVTWDPTFDKAFRAAYSKFRSLYDFKEGDEDIVPSMDGKKWVDVAEDAGFTPDLSGAEKMVESLLWSNTQANTSSPAAAPTPVPTATTDYTAGAKSKLTQLFDAILTGSTKVDRVGIDLRRDTMIFKGVIAGLGGAGAAVNYVFSKITFSPEQLKEISGMSLDSNQKITVASLALVRNLFINIRKESTKGIGNNAFNANSLARAVDRWKSRQTQQPAPAASTPTAAADDGLSTQASIMRAIEIRKMAARKKLGI